MQRTTTRRRREFQRFITRNRRLFPLAGLFLVGVAGGVAVYTAAAGRIPAALMTLSPVPAGGWWQALGSSCFSSVLWLGALFLLGLWGCGAPFILAVPLIHGWGLGLTEAYYYSHGWGGVALAAAAVMPVGLLTAGVLIAAGVQSLRMSVDICHRLLGDPAEDHRRGFRLYCLRYLLFLAAALVVSLLDVLIRGVLLPQ